ncbi:MAG: nucleotidyltransferase family protein [Prevotella sp.]
MDIIKRNFFRLLRSGTFGDSEPVEPMSAWKWERLYHISLMHGVAALVADGIKRHANDFFLQIPSEKMRNWENTVTETEEENRNLNAQTAALFAQMTKEQFRPILLKGQSMNELYDEPLHRKGGDIDIFFPYAPQANKADAWAREHGSELSDEERFILKYKWNGVRIDHHHRLQKLTNPPLNKRLQNIINTEINCCDSSYVVIDGTKVEVLPPTLQLLFIMIRIVRYILNEGISLKQIIDLGWFLRKRGDKVDFVKLQSWMDRLRIQWMARLVGSMLVKYFGFTTEEIPFMNGLSDESVSKIIEDVLQLGDSHNEVWYFTQGRNIFVSTSNSSAMLWQIRHSIKYMKYYPTETITNFFTSFAHSLSHIEE